MSASALALALLSAAALAAGVVFQARGVRAAGDDPPGILPLATRVVRQRVWWGGMSLALLSGLFHAGALHQGTLVEVESIMVTSLLFALAFGTVISRQRMPLRDWISAGLVTGGLVVFLVAADPHGDNYDVDTGRWLLFGAMVLGLTALTVTVAVRARTPNVRTAAWASTAAVLLGSAAVLIKEVTRLLERGPGAVLTAPALYVMVACELGAIVSQQLAYRSGDFAAAVAPFVGGNPLVAGALGIIVFDEQFHRTSGDLVVSALGLLAIAVGITLLATSPLVAVGSGEAESAPAG